MGFNWEEYEEHKPEDPAQAVKSLTTFDAYTDFMARCMKIRSESGGPIPFVLRKAQRRLLQIYLDAKQDGRGIRIVHLKARQYGGSTLIQALMLIEAIQNEDASFLTVAQDADSADHLMKHMAAYMGRRLCDDVKVRVEKERQKPHAEIVLTNKSVLTSATAKNLNLGRSKTFRFLHLSEVAFWWRTLKTFEAADDIFQSVMSTVPDPSVVPDAAVILESTGYGRQGAFYEFYIAARDGVSDWIPFFVPWYEIEKYSMPVPKDERENEAIFTNEIQPEWDDPPTKAVRKLKLDRWELNLINAARGGLTWGQMLWRRHKLADFRGEIERFNQEYPATEDDAFSSTGSPAFSPNAMVWYENRIRKEDDPVHYDVIVTKEGGEVIPEYNGFLHVWRPPEAGAVYVVGADVAAGDSAHKFRATKASYSAAQVLRVDKQPYEQVAEYMARPDPLEFGEILAVIGHWYNTATVAPERNADGYSTIMALHERDYPNLYMPMVTNRNGETRQVYGVQTDMTTKRNMLNQMRYMVTHKSLIIHSLRLIQQMYTVHYTLDGRIAMPRDADLVMSMMIGLAVSMEESAFLVEDEIEDMGVRWDPELGGLVLR